MTNKKKQEQEIPMNSYNAVAIAEGFFHEPYNEHDELRAWAYLIKTGMAWSLQGWLGRTAMQYINNGLIDKAGNITGLEAN